MERESFIITLTGPSQSGKSLVMRKIQYLESALQKEGINFLPKIVPKYTTRLYRSEESSLMKQGKDVDVISVPKLPDNCDLIYQTYGVLYGIATEDLKAILNQKKIPIIIINDIRAVEELKKEFPGRVLSLFLCRKIPELEDFKEEANNRGNVTENENRSRYEKAIAIYRVFIENIALFDRILLNAKEYGEEELERVNTIIDIQLSNLIKETIKGNIIRKGPIKKAPRVFVIAGNAASGKDEIVRAILTMGKLQARVIPKFTMRNQEPNDGNEMICQSRLRRAVIEDAELRCQQERQQMEKELFLLEKNFPAQYAVAVADFRQKILHSVSTGTQLVWKMVGDKAKEVEEWPEGEEDSKNRTIQDMFFELNPDYIDLKYLSENGEELFSYEEVRLISFQGKKYIIYGNGDKLYGCDVTTLKEELETGSKHFILVASQLGVVEALKYLLEDEERIKFVYSHSEISVDEFKKNASDLYKKQKIEKFKEEIEKYAKYVAYYQHVTIYAKSELTYEQTNKEEELVDQMFRLLRAY